MRALPATAFTIKTLLNYTSSNDHKACPVPCCMFSHFGSSQPSETRSLLQRQIFPRWDGSRSHPQATVNAFVELQLLLNILLRNSPLIQFGSICFEVHPG